MGTAAPDPTLRTGARVGEAGAAERVVGGIFVLSIELVLDEYLTRGGFVKPLLPVPTPPTSRSSPPDMILVDGITMGHIVMACFLENLLPAPVATHSLIVPALGTATRLRIPPTESSYWLQPETSHPE
jgi:hypothetical protein